MGFFYFGVMDNVFMNIFVYILFERMFVFRIGLYFGIELLGIWKYFKGKDYIFDLFVFEGNVLDMFLLRI